MVGTELSGRSPEPAGGVHDLLAQLPLLAGLAPDVRELVSGSFEAVRYQFGELIVGREIRPTGSTSCARGSRGSWCSATMARRSRSTSCGTATPSARTGLLEGISRTATVRAASDVSRRCDSMPPSFERLSGCTLGRRGLRAAAASAPAGRLPARPLGLLAPASERDHADAAGARDRRARGRRARRCAKATRPARCSSSRRAASRLRGIGGAAPRTSTTCAAATSSASVAAFSASRAPRAWRRSSAAVCCGSDEATYSELMTEHPEFARASEERVRAMSARAPRRSRSTSPSCSPPTPARRRSSSSRRRR